MKNVFFTLVQKCICLDFLINALMSSNYYKSLNFLYNIKNENLRNIKLICYLYEYTFNDNLVLEDINSFKISKDYEHDLQELLQVNLSILSELNSLKKSIPDIYVLNLLNALTSNYFNFISSIQYFCPKEYNKKIKSDEINSLSSNNSNNIRFFNLIEDLSQNNSNTLNSNSIRQTSLEAINIFFDFNFENNDILDEYYEVFFENNKENKFYQYFVKTENKTFKVRISDYTNKIFYIYQSIQYDIKTSSPINKDEAHTLVDYYLIEKFDDEFDSIIFDKDYINTSTYKNIIESYKFKYNYKDNIGKVNLNKGFYITINALYLNIEEIYLF